MRAVLVLCAAIAVACTTVPDNTGAGGSTASSTTGASMTTSGMTSTSGNSTSSGSAGNVCKFDDPDSTFDNCVFAE